MNIPAWLLNAAHRRGVVRSLSSRSGNMVNTPIVMRFSARTWAPHWLLKASLRHSWAIMNRSKSDAYALARVQRSNQAMSGLVIWEFTFRPLAYTDQKRGW
ncbi:hypothetical protein ACIBH1_45205 [Nonomuraea sp. NPDC050663]|uniref:hypothetical protein n=1 Tax=Nonomuraea sp. NPDC050663 TaxID=3364370 RepID=UPI0037B55502